MVNGYATSKTVKQIIIALQTVDSVKIYESLLSKFKESDIKVSIVDSQIPLKAKLPTDQFLRVFPKYLSDPFSILIDLWYDSPDLNKMLDLNLNDYQCVLP